MTDPGAAIVRRSVCNCSIAFTNSSPDAFRPSKRDSFGDQFTLKSSLLEKTDFEKQLWQTCNFFILSSNSGILLNGECHLLIIVAGVKFARNVISGDVVSKIKQDKNIHNNIRLNFSLALPNKVKIRPPSYQDGWGRLLSYFSQKKNTEPTKLKISGTEFPIR